MKIFIITSSFKKEVELSRYFKNIGLKTQHLKSIKQFNQKKEIEKNNKILIISEQTHLLSKNSGLIADLNVFQEVIHSSTVFSTLIQKEKDEINITKKEYKSQVEGILSPRQKTARKDIYNWDDIFISEKSMISYQDMKDKGIKNSARDLAFSMFIDDMEYLFKFESKVNLNFNKANIDNVVSFEPFIQNMLNNNKYYKVCNKNIFFKNILSNIFNQGVFIRRASDRSQKNYWLPGLNAGIPLTPKKDDIHEATFMFHDIMHFIYPDLIVTDNSENSKNKYIISRMMSEAFTIILADMFFISLLDKDNVNYDFNKRKIYPLFKEIAFDITNENKDKIREILWANTCFALLGEETLLKKLVKNDVLFNEYKEKYQRFFQEDYKWTYENYKNVIKSININKKWYDNMINISPDLIYSCESYAINFDNTKSLKEQVHIIFEEMLNKLMSFSENKSTKDTSLKNAFIRYMIGQMNIFYKYETIYNDVFQKEIVNILETSEINNDVIQQINNIYNLYLTKLVNMNLITLYDKERYSNIFPVFEPFYVFYDSNKTENFNDVLNNIFKDGENNV